MSAAIDWEQLARKHKYKDAKTMFNKLYIIQNRSGRDLSSMFGVTQPVITSVLKKYGFQIKKATGRREGTYICRFCKKQFKGDVRQVCCSSKKCQDKYKEEKRLANIEIIRRRNEKKKENRCVICGRDKGKNRYFCSACHSDVSTGALYDIIPL